MTTDQSAAERPRFTGAEWRAALLDDRRWRVPPESVDAIEAAVLADARARVEALPEPREPLFYGLVARMSVLEALDPPR